MDDENKKILLSDIVIVSNTRTDFEDKEFDDLPPEVKNPLKELAASIKANGVIQAITVKQMPDGKYRLICGERRYRASLLAGKVDIPAVVRDIPDEKILQFQVVENLQRRNISPMDEIRSIMRLRDVEGMTVEEITKAIGKAQSHVSKQILISKGIAGLHNALEKNQITQKVASLIAGLDSPEKQTKAVAALRRENKAFVVKAIDAENWIKNNLGAQVKRQKFAGYNGNGGIEVGMFAADWKYYLLKFSPEQFAEFQNEVKGRKDFSAWANAVEKVMVSSENAESGGGR